MITQEELLDDGVARQLPEPDSRLLNEVRKAYADHRSPLIPNDMVGTQRCEAFLTSDWFTDGTALARAFTILGAADCFDAGGVADVTRTINSYASGARVAVGREEDPVIYVECDNTDMSVDMLNREADWVSRVSYPTVQEQHESGVARPGDNHTQCDHAEPVVPDDRVARANGTENVVRAVWHYE